VPRQNGKNAILEAVELFKMVVQGRRILHTAHEVKTARKAFLRLCSFFENERKYPELAALRRDVRKTNGQEAIFLTNGGSVEFIARSKGSGRGFTVDDLVCDEAQELNDDALAALYPTISAAPSGDPQLILTGTPPAPNMSGDVFTRFRMGGVAGKDSRLCWDEWSSLGSANLDDPNEWAKDNPALGYRLGIEVIRDERAAMDDDTFARERLGVWAEDGSRGALPYGAWMALANPGEERGPEPMFGVDLTEDRMAWISVAWRLADGSAQVMLANDGEPLPGHHVVEECGRLTRQWYATVVAPPALVDDLERAGVRVVKATMVDFAIASGAFADAVASGSVRHGNQAALNEAVKNARWRSAGSQGERAFQLKNAPLVGPLAAAARALHGLNTEGEGVILW
jgi:phage terminase large subunit-like protein